MAIFKATDWAMADGHVRDALSSFFDKIEIVDLETVPGIYTVRGLNDEVPEEDVWIDVFIQTVPGIRSFVLGWEIVKTDKQ